MRTKKLLLFLLWVSAPFVASSGQKLNADPDRIFVTQLKWERIDGAPRSVKERVARGTLTIFYLEGVYAQVSALFIRMNRKEPIGLILKDGFVMQLGSWNRTDDDQLIRIEARDVFRGKMIRHDKCETIAGKQICTPKPEDPLSGPVKYFTCRLIRPSMDHIAETIVCTGGLTVSHIQGRIDLADLPELVRSYVAQQGKSEGK